MSDTNYTLEWRGTKKSGFSYADIEAALATGDLHSLYKINVDGRWVVLRDFVEQQRAAAKRSEAAAAAQPSAAAQQHTAYAPPQALYYNQQAPAWSAQPDSSPMHTQHAMPPPPPPLSTDGQSGQRMPTNPHASPSAQKPAWLWPAIISSATICILLLIVAVYFIASNYSNRRRTDTTIAFSTPPGINDSSERKGDAKVEAKVEDKGESKAEPKGESKAEPKRESKAEAMAESLRIIPYSRAGKEFFPSALVSTYNVQWNNQELNSFGLPIFGEESSWMGLALEGVKKGAHVSVAITVDGFTKASKWEGTLSSVSEDGAVMVMPKLIWNYEALLKVRQQRPVNVSFTAAVDGKPLNEVTETFTMRSINDCPLVLSNAAGKGETNFSFLFAAYVNENHPQVQKILKEAQETGVVDIFNGYQGDPDEPDKIRMQVKRQVFAIWNALQRRGIRYSSVTNTPPGDRMICQSVRFLDESIDNHSANCVDGTVLMASVLQKIGIQSYLVLVPGHCFLAFNEVEDSAAMPTGLETTMLGQNSITDIKKLEFLSDEALSKENLESAQTFVAAMAVGSSRIQGCVLNLQGGGNSKYKLISIKESREVGILPIASEK